MSLNNIKAKLQAQKGFTIVELLIVIVVIGILAAITLVSYNGITSRANAASAKATAATVQKKAELYQADGPTGKYPFAAADFTGAATTASYYMSATNPNWSFAASTATLSASNGTNTVVIRKCAAATPSPDQQATIDTAAEISGLEIWFWDYNTGAVTSTPVDVGDTTACPTAA
ncbi:MAG: type II secretion system protein [Candidatus Microsaccharimonas sp.]